jgi:hypothetical protein
VSSDEDAAGRDDRCHGDEELADSAVDEVDAEGKPERGARVIAGKRGVVRVREVVHLRMRLVGARAVPDELPDQLIHQ